MFYPQSSCKKTNNRTSNLYSRQCHVATTINYRQSYVLHTVILYVATTTTCGWAHNIKLTHNSRLIFSVGWEKLTIHGICTIPRWIWCAVLTLVWRGKTSIKLLCYSLASEATISHQSSSVVTNSSQEIVPEKTKRSYRKFRAKETWIGCGDIFQASCHWCFRAGLV